MQAHASAAIVNFTEGCESDLLPNYLDQLIQKLLQLAGKGAKTVKVRPGAKVMSRTVYGSLLVAAGRLQHKLSRLAAVTPSSPVTGSSCQAPSDASWLWPWLSAAVLQFAVGRSAEVHLRCPS